MEENKDAYHTIETEAEGEYKEKGSKFIAFAKPIKDEDEFSEFMKLIKSRHPKARHHCYAYRILKDDISRFSDDGEPSGTAGRPINNQILSKNLYDTACIVVRYFGGTKLGTSGLIKAYKEASKEAFESANILTMYKQSPLRIRFDYALMGTLLDVIKYYGIPISEKNFGASPELKLMVNNSEVQDVIQNIKSGMLKRDKQDIDEDTQINGLVFFTP